VVLTRISDINPIRESSGCRLHKYSCGCERDDDALEVKIQWVNVQTIRSSSPLNASVKIDFQGSRVTSDGGPILVRELDERLGFGELIRLHLTDSRFPAERLKAYARRKCVGLIGDLALFSSLPTRAMFGPTRSSSS
jgi:hypothetical protein